MDFRLRRQVSRPAPNTTVTAALRQGGIPAGWEGLDAGPKSPSTSSSPAIIAKAKTIIWNGPPGVFEFEEFAEGTKAMADAIAAATAAGAITVVGGGDTATAAKKFGVDDQSDPLLHRRRRQPRIPRRQSPARRGRSHRSLILNPLITNIHPIT